MKDRVRPIAFGSIKSTKRTITKFHDMTNQFGLSRNIPESIKRQVRQRCGYGCVICGTGIVEYEHIRPEFAKAKAHDPLGIALLCPTCHAKKTRNFLSARRVLEAMERPAAKTSGFAFSELENHRSHPYVVLGGMTLMNCPTPVQVGGIPLIRIEQAEEACGPYQITASFFDENGIPSLFIRRNEWQVAANTWDVEAIGGRITVRTGPGEIALQLLLDPGEGVVVERLKMHCGGYLIEADRDHLDVISPGSGRISFRNCLSDNCNVGLALN